jgi:1-acyl-sn-glycerol-3-phosphate acyltransferase
MWGSFFSKAPKSIKKKEKFSFRRDVNITIGKSLKSDTNRSEVKKSIGNLLF